MTDINEKKVRYSVSDTQKTSNSVNRAPELNKSWAERRQEVRQNILGNKGSLLSSWKRVTQKMPRDDAREFAIRFLRQYPKAAYCSEVESWQELEDNMIEFTMRRLPSAD